MKRLLSLIALSISAAGAFAQGHLICQLAPGANPASVASTYGITLLDLTAGAPFAYFQLPANLNVHDLQLMMADDPNVLWAEDDAVLRAPEPQKGSTLPAVENPITIYNGNRAALTQIKWDNSLASIIGRKVRIAILDTGLSPRQPSLGLRVRASINVIEPLSPPHDVPRLQDTNGDGVFDNMVGHGTFVAGIVNMISPNSDLVIARVADSDGYASAWTLIKGLAFAVTSGAEVANVSLGTPDRVPALSDVVGWCDAQGMIVVAAIGNDSQRGAFYPSAVNKAVCVSGLNPNNSKAPFSNWDRSCLGSAPAVGIISTDWDGNFASWSGTSFSTPMVAAAIAEALRGSASRVLPATTLQALEQTNVNLDPFNPSFNRELGGLLNFAKFVQFTGPRPSQQGGRRR